MTIALRELRRRWSQFLPVLVAMTLLVVLLVVLGAFLDGLEDSATGVLRAQGDAQLVLAADAELAPDRSRLPDDAASTLSSVPGVDEVGRLATVATTASLGDTTENVGLVGYDLATDTVPTAPGTGKIVVDAKLAEIMDLQVGDRLVVGPSDVALQIASFVSDVSDGAPTLWVDMDAWLALAGEIDPAGNPVPQVAVVTGDADARALAGALDGVEVATVDEVIAADDVVTQQSSMFGGIIAVTFVVTLIVVALFFILLTIERTALYAVLKAVGARSRDLVAGVAAQAVIIAVTAVVLGIALALVGLQLLPPDLPLVVSPPRLTLLAVATVVVAVLGALGTLRRILTIDPADAIG